MAFQDRYQDPRRAVVGRRCHRAQQGNQFFWCSRFERLSYHNLSLRRESRGLLDPCISGRLRRHISGNFVNCRHDRIRRCLMHHVAAAWNAVKLALSNVGMKAARLFIDVNQPIFLTCDDADGHLQFGILILEFEGIRNHQRGFRCRCPNLGWAHGHLLRKPVKFLRHGLGPKIFAIKTGHMTRLAIGDTVWQITSPAKGTAGAESANTSARALGLSDSSILRREPGRGRGPDT